LISKAKRAVHMVLKSIAEVIDLLRVETEKLATSKSRCFKMIGEKSRRLVVGNSCLLEPKRSRSRNGCGKYLVHRENKMG